MMEIFQKMNFSLLLYDANSSKNPDFLYKITNILTWKNSTKLKWVFGRVSFSKKGHTYCRSDLIHRFGRPVPEIWMITNHVIETVYSLHHHRLTALNHTLMSPHLLQTYADAIQRKGSALPNCFGFIDGTVRPICRPEENQRIVYNGHKRVHGLKYQSVSLPCGMIANMYGPVGNENFLWVKL